MSRFRLEILSLLLLGTGLFLLLERLEIKQILFQGCRRLLSVFQSGASYLVNALTGIQRSDIVGLVLVALAVCVMATRIRFRMIQRQPGLEMDSKCPKCGADLMRIHRKLIHRLLQPVFRVRITRYACKKCDFAATAWASRKQP